LSNVRDWIESCAERTLEKRRKPDFAFGCRPRKKLELLELLSANEVCKCEEYYIL
jgi:hypothetical protein